MVKPIHNFRLGIESIDLRPLNEIVRDKLEYAAENFETHKPVYSDVMLSETKLNDIALSHAYLEVALEYRSDKRKRVAVFNELVLLTFHNDHLDEELDYIEGVAQEPPRHRIPLSTEDAFKKYLDRANARGIQTTLVHELTGKKSNRLKWTEILKRLVIIMAVDKPTKASSQEIYEDLQLLIEKCPDITEQGINLVKPRTIRDFLKNEGIVYVKFAKDEPKKFRKVLGTLRFLPPSSPLVRIGMDAYVFSAVCSDDETEKPFQLVGEFVYDFKSESVRGLAFGHAESNHTFRKAFRDYLANTQNKAPREIVMDRFSAHKSKKVRNFARLLKNKGVKIKRCSNPNNNARLENFFGRFEGKVLGRLLTCSYQGHGIRSVNDHSRPHKHFQIKMRKADFIKRESEMIHILTYLVKEYYNKQFLLANKRTPEENFKREPSNHAAILQDHEVAYTTFDKHKSTILGCGVVIRRGDHLMLFKKRTPEVLVKFHRKKVDTYINPDDSGDQVFVFERDAKRFLFTMDRIAIVPVAEFDRNQEHKDFISSYSKESRELLVHLSEMLAEMKMNVKQLFGEDDYKDHLLAAKLKKEMDETNPSFRAELTEKTNEAEFEFANELSKSKGRGSKKPRKTAEELFEEKYNLG